MGREGTCAVSRGRPSVAETLRARASVICLQHPSLPTVETVFKDGVLKEQPVETTLDVYMSEPH